MGKTRKQFILDQAKIKLVRKILDVDTDTKAVDEALNIVIANTNISESIHKAKGRCNLKDMDQSKFSG